VAEVVAEVDVVREVLPGPTTTETDITINAVSISSRLALAQQLKTDGLDVYTCRNPDHEPRREGRLFARPRLETEPKKIGEEEG
jgi:hypothetical protein